MTAASEHGDVGAALPSSTTAAMRAVARVLADTYGLQPRSMERLGGEVDVNHAVTCEDGRRVVVKLAPADTDLEHLRWQHQLLAGLSQVEDLPPVPSVVPALDGSDIVLVDVDGELCPMRVHTWLPGRTVASLSRHSPELLHAWGRAAGQLVNALPADAPADRRSQTHHWEALRADEAVRLARPAVTDQASLADVDTIMGWLADALAPVESVLPRQVVHQDLNDFNLLAVPGTDRRHRLSGVLDFTDAIYTARVSEIAVAVAYAMLRKPDPLAAAAHVVRGYSEAAQLTDAELRVLYPLAAARLCVNVTTWTARRNSSGAYAEARMEHTWPTIARLVRLPPALAHEWFAEVVDGSASSPAERAAASLGVLPRRGPTARIVGRHLSPLPAIRRRRTDGDAPATLRLGVDIEPGVAGAVCCPVDGVVESHATGGMLLRHGDGTGVWSRWLGVTPGVRLGDAVAAGSEIGLAEPGELLRVCLFTDVDAARLAPPDAVGWASAPAWRRITPDPATWFDADARSAPAMDRARVLDLRGKHFARSQRSYYDDPPRLVSSRDVWLHDDRGMAYLDAINNVSHVGHANERVVRAAHAQSQLLNTNSRFVYDGIAEYAARLAALLPDPLEVVFLVCTGSEANDLALRIARQVTGREDVMVIDGAYHGNTAAVTAVSPNRYKGPGGRGAPETTHEVTQPNRYRGRYGYDEARAGELYAADVAAVAQRLQRDGRAPAAFIAESLLGTAGAIVHPPGYLATAFEAVRSVGGLCISDEVQVGFGRLGSHFWGFEAQGVVPDIVTMGKPIGNGHPMAAVVTTRAIAEAFDTGMKYFNTFGGNPVSCAVGMAVLDELQDRDLQAHAGRVGEYFASRLQALQAAHPLVGDVRGHGLYLGIELVTDRASKDPARDEARYISERMKDEGVLVYPTGSGDNILKIKPPMTFAPEHVDIFVDTLDAVLSDDW